MKNVNIYHHLKLKYKFGDIIVVHAHLPWFSAPQYFLLYQRFKVVSNRLLLFSHPGIYFLPIFYPLPRSPIFLDPITLM